MIMCIVRLGIGLVLWLELLVALSVALAIAGELALMLTPTHFVIVQLSSGIVAISML